MKNVKNSGTVRRPENTRKSFAMLRKIVQALTAIAMNGHLNGFVTGKIYSGPFKQVCVSGLNCYSCPGALGACPVGAMQAMVTGRHPRFAFYVLGFLTAVGAVMGRFVCAWLCPFGLVQELLNKIPAGRKFAVIKADKYLRKLKYVILVVFVILLPTMLRNELGMSVPYFCELICPAGMLEGGIPLLILDKALRPAAHFLYVWKFAILLVVVFASVAAHRPFCKYICPLGAFYSLFNRVSFLKIRVDKTACTSCGACAAACKMQVDPSRDPGSAECIRCGECVKACPHGALRMGFKDLTGCTVNQSAGRGQTENMNG